MGGLSCFAPRGRPSVFMPPVASGFMFLLDTSMALRCVALWLGFTPALQERHGQMLDTTVDARLTASAAFWWTVAVRRRVFFAVVVTTRRHVWAGMKPLLLRSWPWLLQNRGLAAWRLLHLTCASVIHVMIL